MGDDQDEGDGEEKKQEKGVEDAAKEADKIMLNNIERFV